MDMDVHSPMQERLGWHQHVKLIWRGIVDVFVLMELVTLLQILLGVFDHIRQIVHVSKDLFGQGPTPKC